MNRNLQRTAAPLTRRPELRALRQELTGQTVVLPAPDLTAYERFTKRFLDELQPQGPVEEHLAHAIADGSWRLNRIRALENNLLTLGIDEQAASISTGNPEVHSALAMAKSLRERTAELAVLSMHEQRLSRQFERALKQLRELQAERRGRRESQLTDAASLFQMHEEQRSPNAPPYQPAGDGFAFSNVDIKEHIRRKQRRADAEQAREDRECPPDDEDDEEDRGEFQSGA